MIFDQNRIEGATPGGTWNTTGLGTGNYVRSDSAGSALLGLVTTPSFDCYWEVYAHLGKVQSQEAAYNNFTLMLWLPAGDADGSTQQQGAITQHSAVDTLGFRAVRKIWKLKADITYTCYTYWMLDTAATWTYSVDPQYMWMETKKWAR
jgi:hypothetical protein